MFIQNKYYTWYMNIVRSDTFAPVFERHHILPKSMGGSDDHHNMIAGYKKMATSKSGKPAHNRGTSGPKASKETKMRMSSNRIGRKWFHDSNGTYFLRPDGCVSHL